MERIIDCYFIGYNEPSIIEQEKKARQIGTSSPAYQNLNLCFLQYNNQPHTIANLYNLFYNHPETDHPFRPLSIGNIHSLTIAYLATFIHRKGFSFDFVNSFHDRQTELAEKLKKNNIRMIAIPTTYYVEATPIIEIVKFVKEYNDTAKIVIGGPFIFSQAQMGDETTLQYLFKSINADFYVINNQGEATLVELLNALKNKTSVESIPNLVYHSGGRYRINPVFREANPLGENIVDWSLFTDRMEQYATIRTSISCPFSCKFCSFPAFAGVYQTTDVSTIEKELETLSATGKVTCLNFCDDTFNVPPARFKKILRMMIKNKYQFKWNAHFRCQFADPEMVELMKESGCQGVFLGIESGNSQILRNMNKAVTLDKLKEGLALLNQYDIITYASFIIGFPGETTETADDTKRFIEENAPTFFRPMLWYCDPSTPIWQEREQYNIVNSYYDWSHSTMDSSTANNIIEEIFLSVKNSIWVPAGNFELEGIFNLLHRGHSLDQIKSFINAFNAGIKEKLFSPHKKEAGLEVINNLKTALLNNCEEVSDLPKGFTREEIVDKYQAGFDF